MEDLIITHSEGPPGRGPGHSPLDPIAALLAALAAADAPPARLRALCEAADPVGLGRIRRDDFSKYVLSLIAFSR